MRYIRYITYTCVLKYAKKKEKERLKDLAPQRNYKVKVLGSQRASAAKCCWIH